MSATAGKAWPTCYACGLPTTNGAFVCRSCGAIVPIERTLQSVTSQVRRIRRAIDPLHLLVWGLSLVPLLIAPPIMATFIAWRYDKRRPGRMDATWPTIVALLNLTLSVVLIIHFEAQLADSLSWLTELWRSPKKLPYGVQSI